MKMLDKERALRAAAVDSSRRSTDEARAAVHLPTRAARSEGVVRSQAASAERIAAARDAIASEMGEPAPVGNLNADGTLGPGPADLPPDVPGDEYDRGRRSYSGPSDPR